MKKKVFKVFLALSATIIGGIAAGYFLEKPEPSVVPVHPHYAPLHAEEILEPPPVGTPPHHLVKEAPPDHLLEKARREEAPPAYMPEELLRQKEVITLQAEKDEIDRLQSLETKAILQLNEAITLLEKRIEPLEKKQKIAKKSAK